MSSPMEKLMQVAEEKGINVEDLVISAIRNEDADPLESILLRIKLSEEFIRESRERLNTGGIAEKYNLPEYQNALKEDGIPIS